MKYLDPRNDIAFRKIFGTHKNLCISLLNALLPLPEGKEIVSIEYRDPAMFPEGYNGKNSVVDVHCVDSCGRTFLVEMQMYWTDAFFERFVLNTAKAYSGQIKRGNDYHVLQPVYSLCLLNDIFLDEEKYKGTFHHVFMLRHNDFPEVVFEGLTLVFVELAKFKTDNKVHNKMAELWLKFLTRVNEDTRNGDLDQELIDNPLTNEALSYLEQFSYTDDERMAYENYWDMVSYNRTLINGKMRDAERIGFERGEAAGFEKGEAAGFEKGEAAGFEKGEAAGFEKGEAAGFEKGEAAGFEKGEEKGFEKGMKEVAKRLKLIGADVQAIIAATGLSEEELNGL